MTFGDVLDREQNAVDVVDPAGVEQHDAAADRFELVIDLIVVERFILRQDLLQQPAEFRDVPLAGAPAGITFRLETRADYERRRQGMSDAAANATTAPRTPPDESWRLPPEPRRYPSCPDAISAPPPWLVSDEGAPFDIAAHFEMPVREENAAPLYLDRL